MWKKLREKQRNRQECTTAAAVVRILGGKFLEVHMDTMDAAARREPGGGGVYKISYNIIISYRIFRD